MKTTPPRLGFSIVGLLVGMACLVVLMSILLTAVNKATTGQGTQQAGTVRTVIDEMYLAELYKSMLVYSNENRGRYPVPSVISGSDDVQQDTTANLFSAMVMNQYAIPKQLIAENEYNNYVEEMTSYDFTKYNAAARVFWDPEFKADLQRSSHVSFAHQPLCGKRLELRWKSTMDSRTPLLGNRGPKDGVPSASSTACGRDGTWGGNIVFGDGHVEFTKDPTLGGMTYEEQGERFSDNLFKMETGWTGLDAILSFTKAINRNGVQLQFD